MIHILLRLWYSWRHLKGSRAYLNGDYSAEPELHLGGHFVRVSEHSVTCLSHAVISFTVKENKLITVDELRYFSQKENPRKTQPSKSTNLGRVHLGSIRKKNNWNNASKRFFWELFSFRNTCISIPAILLSRVEWIYSGIYFYSGISQTSAPLHKKWGTEKRQTLVSRNYESRKY